MSQVLVRDLEPGVIEKLKTRARQNGRSLEAELRVILQQAAGASTTDYVADMERIRQLFAGREFGDSTNLVREDRER